jgi:hypothetical protein
VVTKTHYGKREVDAANRVLVELVQILGEYREHMVLVGGWTPYFLFGGSHTGSTDIDIALELQEITNEKYETIRQNLEKRGYRQGPQPFQFLREIVSDAGGPILVEVDFLAGEYGGTGKSRRHQEVQGNLKARKTRGCELALKYNTPITIEGLMPDGAANSVQINLCDVAPFIVMKGMALSGRLKEKDAWDIYFCLKKFAGGVRALAEEFKPIIQNELVVEGLRKIRSKFRDIDSLGPALVADFEEVAEAGARSQIKRDAFEQVDTLLTILDIATGEDRHG